MPARRSSSVDSGLHDVFDDLMILEAPDVHDRAGRAAGNGHAVVDQHVAIVGDYSFRSRVAFAAGTDFAGGLAAAEAPRLLMARGCPEADDLG